MAKAKSTFNPFALEERTIKDKTWEGEYVVITELSYADKARIDNMSLGDMTVGVVTDEEAKKKTKVGSLSLEKMDIARTTACIVSWTFTNNGSPIPVDEKSVGALSARVAHFINKKIKELNPEVDNEFPGDGGNGSGEGDEPPA